MIDESQFEKEADPSFATRRYPDDPRFWNLVMAVVTPNFVYRRRYKRARLEYMRQSYDDAEGESTRR